MRRFMRWLTVAMNCRCGELCFNCRCGESTHPVGQIFFEVFGWPSGFEFGDFLEVYAEVYAGISLEGFMQGFMRQLIGRQLMI